MLKSLDHLEINGIVFNWRSILILYVEVLITTNNNKVIIIHLETILLVIIHFSGRLQLVMMGISWNLLLNTRIILNLSKLQRMINACWVWLIPWKLIVMKSIPSVSILLINLMLLVRPYFHTWVIIIILTIIVSSLNHLNSPLRIFTILPKKRIMIVNLKI